MNEMYSKDEIEKYLPEMLRLLDDYLFTREASRLLYHRECYECYELSFDLLNEFYKTLKNNREEFERNPQAFFDIVLYYENKWHEIIIPKYKPEKWKEMIVQDPPLDKMRDYMFKIIFSHPIQE